MSSGEHSENKDKNIDKSINKKTESNDKADTGSTQQILKIAIPVVIQNMISAGLGLVDVLMIGQLGETAITSVGISNQYFNIFFLAIFGISAGAQIYLAQYWGDKNIDNFHKTMGVALIPSLFFLLIFFLPAILAPHFVISLFSSDAVVINLASRYLRIAALGFPFHLILQILFCAFRATGNASFPMLISTVALGINTGLNYLLITGNHGFPALGVSGAALATIIAAATGMIIMLAITALRDTPIKAKIAKYFEFNRKFFKMILFAALPIAVNEMCWALGSSLFGMSFSRYSTSAFASYEINIIITSIVFTFGIGLAIADSVIIGNLLGANELEKARKLELKFTKMTIITSICASIILFTCAKFILIPFNVSGEVEKNALMMMKTEALFIPFKFYTLLHLVGTLRAGGDSMAAIAIDMSTMYLIGVPAAFISLHVFELPLFLALACIYSEEILKTILCHYRLKSGIWVKNLVKDI